MTRTRKEGAEHRSSGRKHEARTQQWQSSSWLFSFYRDLQKSEYVFICCIVYKVLLLLLLLSRFTRVRLCDPMDCSPSGSSVHGLPQARILEWVAISFSRRSSWPRGQIQVSYASCVGRQVLYCQRHQHGHTECSGAM